MNQILSTSMPINNKKNRIKNGNSTNISSILKFFGISILFFGIFMLSTGAYAIYENQIVQQEENLEPTISIENKTDKSILLKVLHGKNIAKVEYGWNNEKRTVINGNSGKYFETEINLISGNNTLHILVQDEDGKEITYEKQYEIESNINFEVSGNKIKIICNSDKTISYMTYRWDEEEEKRIEVNDTSIEEEIEAINGLHTLTVIVVDEDNNTDTKIQKINGVSKPKLVIEYDEPKEHFVIKVSDNEKLSKIEFTLNQDYDQVYVLNLEEMNLKELEYTLPMEFVMGENIIEVTVYNSNGITNEYGAKYIKY